MNTFSFIFEFILIENESYKTKQKKYFVGFAHHSDFHHLWYNFYTQWMIRWVRCTIRMHHFCVENNEFQTCVCGSKRGICISPFKFLLSKWFFKNILWSILFLILLTTFFLFSIQNPFSCRYIKPQIDSEFQCSKRIT